MRYLIQCFLVMVMFSAPALACEPLPEFPMPDDIESFQLIVSREGKLTETEQAAFDTFNADRARYVELYEQAYPCPLAGDSHAKRLRAANSDAMIEELGQLRDKWTREESVPDQALPAGSAEYIDVPDDEMLLVE